MIKLRSGGNFKVEDLVNHIKSSGRNYIIQGQIAVSKADHHKPNSLDYWLRDYASDENTKLADDEVIGELLATGLFIASDSLTCPDSGRLCKGLVLCETAENKSFEK